MGKERFMVILAHPAQQHSYRTALALKEHGYLMKYITTVYQKNFSWTRFITLFLKGDELKRAVNRKCEGLYDTEVKQFCELESLFLLLLQRIDKRKYFYNRWSRFVVRRFNKKVAKFAIKHNADAVILYDTMAYSGFEILRKKKPQVKKILDMSAPGLPWMDRVFRDDLDRACNEEYSSTLKQELESELHKQLLRESESEIKFSDNFLVASSMSEKSLQYNGISKEKIFNCPYGINSDKYKDENIRDQDYCNRKLNYLFVGRITQKKGVFHLFEAIKKVDLNTCTFTFVGTCDKTSAYYRDFKSICNFTGHVTRDQMSNLYSNADILIFPSLADGFGLSVLEALACGLPVVCSDHTGASDLIVDGYNGFVIPAGNGAVIFNTLQWFDKNRDKLYEMSKNARNSVQNCTWNRYNDKIDAAMRVISASK